MLKAGRTLSELRERIRALHAELDGLNDADKLYWAHPNHSAEGESAYHRRRARVQAIRKEIGALAQEEISC